MKTMMTVLAGLMIISFSGCGTVKGLGEDITSVGGWFQKSSTSVKEGSTVK